MKRALILILIVSSLIAREGETAFSFGAKGGISFNHFLGDIPIELDPLLYTGFTVGILGNYKVNDNFSIQPEILYSKKGSNFKEFEYSLDAFELTELNLEMYVQTTWIEIPILAMYHINDNFAIFGGPYLGIYLNGKLVAEPSIGIEPTFGRLGLSIDYDIEEENLRLPDYGIVIGGAYTVSENLAIQGRWELGIQNLADDFIVDFLNDDSIVINNSSFQLQLEFTI